MKWITRCPDCGTVYTLDLGQLKMANGWLRCGHCQHIFDSSGLVVSTDLVPTLTDAVSPARLQSAPLHLRQWLHLEDQPSDAPQLAPAAPPRTEAEEPAAADHRATSTSPEVPSPATASPAAAPVAPAMAPAESPTPPVTASPPPVASHPIEDFAQALKNFPGPQSLQRPANARLQRWLMGLCIALSLSLLWQGLLAVRRPLLLQWPALTPVVHVLCLPIACEPVPPGTDLWQLAPIHWTPGHAQGVRLDWTLSHRAPTPQATPALQMTVVDARGQILSQRILSPEQWGAPAQLAPGLRQEGHLQLQGPESRHISAIRLNPIDPLNRP